MVDFPAPAWRPPRRVAHRSTLVGQPVDAVEPFAFLRAGAHLTILLKEGVVSFFLGDAGGGAVAGVGFCLAGKGEEFFSDAA